MDRRRTRWVAHDVYFLDEGLGAELFDRFGAAGIALWHGFIAACKKNHVEGETTFTSDTEALLVFGLPGMPLVDADGQEFKLDDWLALLSAHKVIRRSTRTRRTKVACSKWDRWQRSAKKGRDADRKADDRSSAGGQEVVDSPSGGGRQVDDRPSEGGQDTDDRSTEGERNSRSDPGNTRTIHGRKADETSPDLDSDSDTDRDTDKNQNLAPAARPADELFDAMVDVCNLDPAELTKSARGRVNRAVKELRDINASPQGVRARAEVHRSRWPNAELTPTSLAANYAQLGTPQAPLRPSSRDGPGHAAIYDALGDELEAREAQS